MRPAATDDRGVGDVAPRPVFATNPFPASCDIALEPDVLARARILVVDDTEANVSLLEHALRRGGARNLYGVTDARLVVDRCLAVEPDLILLDLYMPHLDGVEVLSAVRQVMPRDAFLPVVVLTADAGVGARDRALAAGATDFLTKPVDTTEVLLRVTNLLHTRALYLQLHERNERMQQEIGQLRAEQQDAEQLRVARLERVRHVLQGDTLEMVFQPIAELASSRVVGVEALARFGRPPERPANEWFADAAAVGLGCELELLAVRRALEQVEALDPDWFVSVNVSPTTAVTDSLRTCLGAVSGERVVVELTEHEQIRDYSAMGPALGALRREGIRIAADDAGAGFAGLQHILRLQPDIVKLDCDITSGIDTDPVRRSLAAALVRFGSETGAVLVAEGIENPAELETLRGIGVPWGQGWYLGPPAPPAGRKAGS